MPSTGGERRVLGPGPTQPGAWITEVKTFNLITNLNNGAGLQRDAELLRGLLESHGHRVIGTMFNDPRPVFKQHDVNIFLEVVTPAWVPYAHENWIIPNSEWWYPTWDYVLPQVNRVLCKTQDCYRLWTKKVPPARCVFIGFESHDLYNPTTPRKPAFLHMAGKSETKNTAAVMEAWKRHSLPYPLTVVAFKPDIVAVCENVPNVTHITRLSDAEVAAYMNEFEFHVMPSKYEGFGHYIHEAIGCGGIVITTDAPPMNEFNGIPKELLIPVERRERRLEAFFNLVHPSQIAAKVHAAARLSPERKAEIHARGREAFLADRAAFRAAMTEVLHGL
jgi:glycosyltransferase involved in cell wall biosynthesis